MTPTDVDLRGTILTGRRVTTLESRYKNLSSISLLVPFYVLNLSVNGESLQTLRLSTNKGVYLEIKYTVSLYSHKVDTPVLPDPDFWKRVRVEGLQVGTPEVSK